jgi:hypothetical protein
MKHKHFNGHARSVPPRDVLQRIVSPTRNFDQNKTNKHTFNPTSANLDFPERGSKKPRNHAPIRGMVCEVSKNPKNNAAMQTSTTTKHYVYDQQGQFHASLPSTSPHLSTPLLSPHQQSTPTSIPQRHPLNPINQRPPAISLQLSILHPLLRPILMRPRNPPNHALEKQDLVAHALADENAARVLVDDRLFVL